MIKRAFIIQFIVQCIFIESSLWNRYSSRRLGVIPSASSHSHFLMLSDTSRSSLSLRDGNYYLTPSVNTVLQFKKATGRQASSPGYSGGRGSGLLCSLPPQSGSCIPCADSLLRSLFLAWCSSGSRAHLIFFPSPDNGACS